MPATPHPDAPEDATAPEDAADAPPPAACVTEEEYAEWAAVQAAFGRAQQRAQASEERAIRDAAEARDAAAVLRHVSARMGAKYRLADGDRIADDRTIARAAAGG